MKKKQHGKLYLFMGVLLVIVAVLGIFFKSVQPENEAHKDFLAEEMLRRYHKGSILKYLLHYRKKNGLEDLKKARKHLDWLIELEEL